MKATVLSREQKQSAAESNPRSWRVAAAILALLVFLPVDTTAQKPPSPRPAVVSPPGVLVRLLDLNGSRLDVPAVVWFRSLSLSMNIPGSAFSGEVVFPGLRPGRYTVEAEAPGYVTTRETVEILSEGNFVVLLYMRPEPPRGVTAGPPGPPVLAPKARQEAEKGLQALQANNNLAKARKHLEVALHLAPNHPDVNYLWGILWLEENNWAQAKVFLEKSVSLDSKHRFGLVALSRLHYRQHEYAEAIGLLKRALELDPSSWRVHWLLASAYLRLSEFAKAREHAELALKSGKEKAGEAQLVLGQALAALGEKEKAWRALESFLNAYPTHPAAEHARRLLEALRQGAAELVNVAAFPVQPDPAALAPPMTPVELSSPPARWAPADVDTVLPAVFPDKRCSLPDVLSATSQRVKELVTNLQQFTATEWLEHEQVDASGNARQKETRTFTYLAAIEQTRPGMLSVDEYRNGATSLEAFPARLATTGLAALALIFHPYYVTDFEMSCEGLGQWRGLPAWQLHFRQRDDRPSRMRSYHVNHLGYPVKLKGRAWIAADTYQVVRLETDLAEEIPAIRLRSEHLAIEYRPVQFQKRHVELWLPESAELYLDFKGHRYHRRHSFSDFQLFAVDVDQTIHSPGEP
ncbi:MAG TPA: tetratricopeptide repeat protein [Candidatus Acidoferrales bacterium]|nr:tetratricopeptide repeat protein [Candidatus Acidoferrales bacterium]